MKRIVVFLVAVILAAGTQSGAADGRYPRFEIFFGGGLDFAGTGTLYAHLYDPHPGYGVPGSYARQTLSIDLPWGGTLSAGGSIFFDRHWGLRLTVARSRSEVEGENGPFDLLFKYTSYPPLDFNPVEASRTMTIDWAPTTGAFYRTTAGLEVVFRLPVSPDFDLAASVGPFLSRTRGEIRPLGYVEYMASFHGYPYFSEYLLDLGFPPQTTVGVSASVEAAVRMTGRLFLSLRANYRSAAATEATPEITQAYDYVTVREVESDKLRSIKSLVPLHPVSLALPTFGVGLGLVWRF
jgi:hypothetical protein